MSEEIIDAPEIKRTALIHLVNGKSYETSLTASSIVNHIAYNNPRVVSLVRPDGQSDIHILVNNIAFIEEIETEV